MNTEDILWQAIKDIESGTAKTIKEDPLNGWLNEKSRKGLTKINICSQSAKYTKNNQPISRPTLDSYANIVEYIEGKNTKKSKEDKINELNNKLNEYREINNSLKEAFEKIAYENYELQEKINILENEKEKNIKSVHKI